MTNSNIKSYLDELMKDVRELGREAALGKDSLPKLAVRVVKAADAGILSLDRDAEQRDDAVRIYEEYASSESKKAVHEHTDNGKKANVSKVRTLIKLGVNGGSKYDAVELMAATMEVRKEMIAADPKSVKPAYAAYVDIARAQLERDSQMTADEIKETIRKAEPAEPDLEKKLTTIQKSLEKIITGEAGVKDQSDEIVQAHDLIKQRLAALVMLREDEDLEKRLAARGLKVMRDATEQVEAEQVEAEQIAA